MTSIRKTVLIASIFLFGVSYIETLNKDAIVVMIFTLCIPGPLLGLIIPYFKPSTFWHKLLFFLVSSILYFLTVYFLDISRLNYKLSPLKLLIASTINFILLQLAFDIIFNIKIHLKNTFTVPAILGFAAALIPTISIFFFDRFPNSEIISKILWACFLSIVPAWYVLFAKHLVDTGKVSS